ncbi:MAG TPA: hydrogenase maturation protease [Solirubrobacteraceae bacterium]|nr:hydrogenase maturation protease [Solirubrobacteraceae bacterium]
MSGAAVVLGLGNVAQADDGLGIHAVRELLARYDLPPEVEVIEGGTAGLLLVPVLSDADRAVIVDAIDLGAVPGTLHRLEGRAWSTAFLRRFTPHDAALSDLLGATALAGALPAELLLLGLQPERIGWGCEPTSTVATAIPVLVDAVADVLCGWGVRVERRLGICA